MNHLVIMQVVKLTSTSLGQLGQSQRSIISRDRLKSNVTMPLIAALLLIAECLHPLGGVDLLKQLGADGANLLIAVSLFTDFSLAVEDRVDMQP